MDAAFEFSVNGFQYGICDRTGHEMMDILYQLRLVCGHSDMRKVSDLYNKHIQRS